MTCPKCGQPVKEDVRFCGNCGAAVGQPGSEEDSRLASFERVLGYKYKITKKVGVGGFAEVFLGEHAQLGRKVAIKILRTSFAGETEMIERFRRESKSAAKLSHPNIIDIYDVGEGEGIYYFVMKLIEGETLSKKMQRDRQMIPGEAISIIKQVADALAYAHEHDVIHRDIKPANVMLDQFRKPILMDFGIARVQMEGNLTKTGTLMGTPHYLPPEQPLGRPVDGRSDIYSLGIMFYEMLAGKPPFHDENSVTLIFKHINEPAPPLKDVVPDLAPELTEVVHKMIEKLPEKRFQSANDLVDALDALSAVYPMPTPSTAGRAGRTSGGASRNTEQLLALAKENLSLQKFDKAIEIYATVVKRDPNNEIAMSAINDMAYILAERLSVHISKNEFSDAKQIVSQLSKLPVSEDRVANYKVELESAEQKYAKDAEFNSHFDAARVALEHDNAGGAIEKLTKALTVNPANKEAQDLLKQARAAYETNRQAAEFENTYSEAEFYYQKGSYDQALAAIKKCLDINDDPRAQQMYDQINAAMKEKAYKRSEQEKLLAQVDEYCEHLDFEGARAVLEASRSDFPVFVEAKSGSVERSLKLYQQYLAGKESYDQSQWVRSKELLAEFLNTPPPYDFQVMYSLRKDAEEAVKGADRELKLQSQYKKRKSTAEVDQLLKKADVLVRMGQLEQAREECMRLLLETGNHPSVIEKLREIESKLPPEQRRPIPGDEPVAPIQPKTIQMQKSGLKLPAMPAAPKEPPAPKPAPQESGTRLIQKPVLPSKPPQPAAASAPAPVASGEPSSGKNPIIYVLAGLGVLLVGGLLYFFLAPSKKVETTQNQNQNQHTNTTTVAAKALPVSIDSQPWATITISGGDLKDSLHDTTPATVSLPPGRYTVVFENPELSSFTQSIDVHEANTAFSFPFQNMSADKLADTAMK